VSEIILVVEDEAEVRQLLRRTLEREGMQVLAVENGVDGLVAEKEKEPSLILLDIMLPDIDGVEVCRRIRKRSTIPVLMLTAKGDQRDIVDGLEAGADDYVVKPFSTRELVARVRAALRRTTEYAAAAAHGERLDFGILQLDAARHEVLVRGEEVRLTPKEFDLLHLLARNEGQMLRREELLARIWGYDSSIDSRTLDVHIGRLRAKIEQDPKNPRIIVTAPSVGYKFVAPQEQQAA